MCGILVYKDTHPNEFYIKNRGQDFRGEVKRDGFTFIHHLLSITGKFYPQPFVEDNIICLFNGEVYNHKYINSDGENLIPLYKEYGVTFPKQLDGEWAIALYDFDKKRAVFATDLFATKPLWRKGLECASYESGLPFGEARGTLHKIPANTIEVVNFDGGEEIYPIHTWDLNQYKDNFDDWTKAFEKSVKKRASENCFLGLSSGYDSGAIACELLKLNVFFKAYIVEGREDKEILEKRREMMPSYEYFDNKTDYKQELDWLNSQVEHFAYKGGEGSIQDDKAALPLSKICKSAHLEGRKVYLSGQGADEIISDYSLYPNQSTFKGTFPDKIEGLWENFYDFCQYNYIAKEEYVAGSHSIETRYPFLDKQVVQEFLWLKPELKNSNYKAPIHEYLKTNNFPFKQDVKVGLR